MSKISQPRHDSNSRSPKRNIGNIIKTSAGGQKTNNDKYPVFESLILSSTGEGQIPSKSDAIKLDSLFGYQMASQTMTKLNFKD